MTRVARRKESIEKFIKTRGCLNLDPVNDKFKFVEHRLLNSRHIVPIAYLTLLSTLNKKHKRLFQGYYVATALEMLNYLHDLRTLPYNHTDNDIVPETRSLISILILKSFNKNMSVIQSNNHLNDRQIGSIYHQFYSEMTDLVYNMAYKDLNPTLGANMDPSIYDKYLKDFCDKNMKKKFSALRMIAEDDIERVCLDPLCDICEIAMVTGWTMGSGSADGIENARRIGRNLGIMYKISNDLENIENDLAHSNKYTNNYIINVGIVQSHELFMESKNMYIKLCSMYKVYSDTMREIVDDISDRVDTIIDNVSMDIKSLCSTTYN